MYDVFDLEDNTRIERPSRTRFYFLTNSIGKINRELSAPRWDTVQRNYVFLNTNHTDSYYLINNEAPSIGVEAIVIKTNQIAPKRCYDIVFISNGETKAEEHYEHLLSLGLPNKIHRVKDVKGRNKAYKQAAQISETPYFFAVFAKIKVDPNFKFDLGCEDFDRRHYVYRSYNPVNRLTYGHQGIIAYNKESVLNNPGDSIDFTMAQLYRELPISIGVAHFNTSPYETWRAAFRESLKLAIINDETSLERLHIWRTVGESYFGEYSVQGANDAYAFFEKFKDKPEEYMKTYEWSYLEKYYESLYGKIKP